MSKPITAEQIAEFIRLLKAGKVSRAQFQNRLENPLSWVAFFKQYNDEWIEDIVEAERATHVTFFGEKTASNFDYSKLEKVLKQYGQAKIKEWAGLGLRVAYLPPVEMTQEKDFPGWKVRPEKWFYEKIAEGKIDSRALWLGDPDKKGEVDLIDTRCKPQYDSGKQMWEGDENFLGPIIEGLRNEGKIAKYDYGPQSSRFGVSDIETEQQVWPHLAKILGFNAAQVMSESVVQGSYLSQAYPDLPRSRDGQTNTAIWFKERFEGGWHRFLGGDSGDGGRADVGCSSAGHHYWRSISCLPLVVLSP